MSDDIEVELVEVPPETGIAFLPVPDNFSLNFSQDGHEIGSLTWTAEDEMWTFEGQLRPSADIFFEMVKNQFEDWYKRRYHGTDGADDDSDLAGSTPG